MFIPAFFLLWENIFLLYTKRYKRSRFFLVFRGVLPTCIRTWMSRAWKGGSRNSHSASRFFFKMLPICLFTCSTIKKTTKKNKFIICVLVGEFLRNRQKADLGRSFLSHIPSDFPRSTWLQYTSSVIPKLPGAIAILSCKNWVSWQGGRGTKWITISLPAAA